MISDGTSHLFLSFESDFSNSTKYACSYMISSNETPIIIFNDNQCIMKGGFWDGRLEFNNLSLENANEPE